VHRDALHAKPGFENVYNDTNARAMERLPLFCVPIPGLSPWAQPAETSLQSEGAAAAADSSAAKKRSRDDAMDCDQQQQLQNSTDEGAAARSAEAAAVRSGSSSSSNVGGSNGTSEQQAAFRYQQELQLLREAGLPCLARVYDAAEGDLKLNDAVEFVGVLSFDDESSDAQQLSGDAADDMQTAAFLQDGLRRQMLECAADSNMQQEVPPPSLVPRLHVITYRKVSM
jgi:Mini-chromosome maintenance replisome factor